MEQIPIDFNKDNRTPEEIAEAIRKRTAQINAENNPVEQAKKENQDNNKGGLYGQEKPH